MKSILMETFFYVSHIDGHFLWDGAPEMCDEECTCYCEEEDSEAEEYIRQGGEKIHQAKSQCSQRYNRRYHKDDDGKDDGTPKRRPWVGIQNLNVGPIREEYHCQRTAE